MTERGANDLVRDGSAISIGPSLATLRDGALELVFDEIAVPFPRRLRGTARIELPRLETTEYALDAAGVHLWRPLAPRARIDVQLDAPRLRWSGDCYVDSNFGARPLEQDFVSWNWSRAHLANGAAIVYEALRRDGGKTLLALRFENGEAAAPFAPPPRVALPPTLWRLRGETRADAGSTPRLLRKLEDAPFYSRSVLGLWLLGEDTEAVHESLSLDRFTRTTTQFMLPFRMPRRA